MWHFGEIKKGQPERDPHEAEFFNLNDPPNSLVREVIQNSLDAKLEHEEKIKVCFSFGNTSKLDTKDYYEPLIPHLRASKLIKDEFEIREDIRFISIEDYNTKGLDGAITRIEKNKGNYYSFWWYEGKSNKTGASAGRWGLGKTVFHASSELKAFWGLTVRSDDSKELLLGKAVMRTHPLKNELYDYYAYFSENNMMPIEDQKRLGLFKEAFQIERDNEPGLSIVIPLPVEEITPDTIVKAVVIQYFYPIIKDRLEVSVKNEDCVTNINQTNLRNLVNQLCWDDTEWSKRNVDKLMEFLENAATSPEDNIIHLKKPVERIKMGSNLLPGNIETFSKKYVSGEFLAFRLPIQVTDSYNSTSESQFDVYLQRDDELNRADEFYIRSGITITDSEMKQLRSRPVRALLSAQDLSVSRFLGDAETPAHTFWNERTEDFKGKYENAVSTLRYIKTSMRELVNLLDIPPEGKQLDLLKDIFFIESENEIDDEEGVEKTTTPRPIPPQQPAKFIVNRTQGGFFVRATDEIRDFPITVIIEVAYDIRRRNAFTNYSPLDFQFSSDELDFEIEDGNFLERNSNKLTIKVLSSEFSLRVTGFDKNRDLITRLIEV